MMVHPGNGGGKDTTNKTEALGDYDAQRLPVRHMVLMTMMMMLTMIMMMLWA